MDELGRYPRGRIGWSWWWTGCVSVMARRKRWMLRTAPRYSDFYSGIHLHAITNTENTALVLDLWQWEKHLWWNQAYCQPILSVKNFFFSSRNLISFSFSVFNSSSALSHEWCCHEILFVQGTQSWCLISLQIPVCFCGRTWWILSKVLPMFYATLSIEFSTTAFSLALWLLKRCWGVWSWLSKEFFIIVDPRDGFRKK